MNSVRRVLDQIFGVLYGDSGPVSEELEEECHQWSSKFHHMRVVGHQVVEEHGDGTEEILTDTPPATAEARPRMKTQAETTSIAESKK